LAKLPTPSFLDLPFLAVYLWLFFFFFRLWRRQLYGEPPRFLCGSPGTRFYFSPPHSNSPLQLPRAIFTIPPRLRDLRVLCLGKIVFFFYLDMPFYFPVSILHSEGGKPSFRDNFFPRSPRFFSLDPPFPPVHLSCNYTFCLFPPLQTLVIFALLKEGPSLTSCLANFLFLLHSAKTFPRLHIRH